MKTPIFLENDNFIVIKFSHDKETKRTFISDFKKFKYKKTAENFCRKNDFDACMSRKYYKERYPYICM